MPQNKLSSNAIYQGWVSHQRFKPKAHGFRYQVFMMFLNLDELPTMFNNRIFWSFESKNIAWFKRADYFGDPAKPLKDEISQLVEVNTGKKPSGPICMLTNMRYFGYCFNPVTFYYCFEDDGETLQAIVSHITNTPWNESFAYVHDYSKNRTIKFTNNGELSIFKFSKAFHVSPFMPMNIDYDWAFQLDQEQLHIHMKNLQNEQLIFNATLSLHRTEFNPSKLNALLIKYPFMTIKVVLAIYWSALKLWLKRVPFYSHPNSTTKP
ncbi:DUF1365 domain-containing protein [Methylotenera sp. L2L1]|uniref:DUF1365 domain-containing protein n=1 Tax=Methylotenera sp. L2L1 TaxID=1502770 RepID=UPI000567A3AE|nr:DUF1365 domain-containing protein [Methylotenera sp. L2L1]